MKYISLKISTGHIQHLIITSTKQIHLVHRIQQLNSETKTHIASVEKNKINEACKTCSNWSKNRDNLELVVGCDGRDKHHNKTLKSKI